MAMNPLSLYGETTTAPKESTPSEVNTLTGQPYSEGKDSQDEPQEEQDVQDVQNEDFYENLVDLIPEHCQTALSSSVIDNLDNDKNSRKEWIDVVAGGLSLLGTRIEETSDPFPGACAAHHPLILESAVKFQAKASLELFNPKGPVRTAILGPVTDDKEAQASRVKNHMNFQVMHEMEEYFDETETLLFYLPIVGSAFKKTYYNEFLKRNVSEFIPVDSFVVNYYATNLKNASQFSHVIQRSSLDLKKDIHAGLYADVNVGMPSTPIQGEVALEINQQQGFNPSSKDEIHTLVEQYLYYDFPEDKESDPDGIPLPYCVTVDLNSKKVLAIRRNWKPEDTTKTRCMYFTHYKFVPGMGFYGLGFIHLLGNLQMTLTTAMRSLVDAGMFANLQAGFVDKRLRIRSGDGPLSFGEFREVEAAGVDLDKAIKIFPFKEPSTVLMQMYQFIEARGQKFADSTEQVIQDSTNYGPVGTTLALLEASTKFFSGVHKRLHQAQKSEFKIIGELNYRYLEETKDYEDIENTFQIKREDYNGEIQIIPISDPNNSSQSQKLTIAQAVQTHAQQNPQGHNMYEVSKYYYNAIGIDEYYIEKLLPAPQSAQPQDPISDLMGVQKGLPIKAFPGQDHKSHIAIKMAFVQDPSAGGNQANQALIPKILANVQEHTLLQFQEQTEALAKQQQSQGQQPQVPQGQQQQGQPQQGQGQSQGLPPEVLAIAAQQLSQQNQKMAQMQAQGPDALLEVEKQRVANEGRKIDSKDDIERTGLQIKMLELELKKVQEDNKMALAGMKEQIAINIAQMQEKTGVEVNRFNEFMDVAKRSMDHKAVLEHEKLKARLTPAPKEPTPKV